MDLGPVMGLPGFEPGSFPHKAYVSCRGVYAWNRNRRERLSILKSALKDPDYELWIAEANGEIVGFIDLWTIHDFCHGGKLSYIQNLYVAQKYRRLGVGSKLLQKVVERAEEGGALEIHVVTKFDNEPAIRLYKKHGLTEESLQLEK